ncbi:MAG: hypothetical protein AAFX09_07930 [Pseudomonadota bacterium]
MSVFLGSGLTSTFNANDADDPTYLLNNPLNLTSVEVNGVTYLYSTDVNDDGIGVWRLNSDGTLTVVQMLTSDDIVGTLTSPRGMTTAEFGGVTYLYVGDSDADGLVVFSINSATGALTYQSTISEADNAAFNLTNPFDELATATVGSTQFVIASGGSDDGFSVFSVGANGALTNTDNITNGDDAGAGLDFAREVKTAVVGGNTFVFVTASVSDALNVYQLDASGNATFADAVLDTDDANYELDGARALEVVEVGGTTYAIVGGLLDDGISVFSVASNGVLTNVFNLADDATLSLDGVRAFHILDIGGEPLLAASSFEDAVTIFRVNTDGSLTEVTTIVDDATINMQNPEGVRLATVDGRTFVINISHIDDGISVHELGGGVDNFVGTPDADQFFGLGGADVMSGAGGDDFLDGGAGSDTMSGGTGNDAYVVDDLGDVVTEVAGEGRDRVFVEVSGYTLSANVEIGALTEAAGAASLTGNSGANTLFGNSQVNTLTGGDGDDIYRVGNSADTIVENSGEGRDMVLSDLSSYTLGDNIEVGILLDGAGAGSLTGNAEANWLYGNSDVNTLTGGDGDDVYYVGNVGDVVVENANEGRDRVYSDLSSYTLGDNIEIGYILAGGGDITGNSADNILRGNDDANVIAGADGVDVIVTGGGADTIAFRAVSELGDSFTDWSSANDTLQFEASAFGFGVGASLTNGVNFIASADPSAVAAQASFLWDDDDFILYYDVDGTGSGAAVRVAWFQDGASLSADDFTFVDDPAFNEGLSEKELLADVSDRPDPFLMELEDGLDPETPQPEPVALALSHYEDDTIWTPDPIHGYIAPLSEDDAWA